MSRVTLPSVGAILFTADQIAEAVRGMATRLASELPPEPILLVGVLKGAWFVTADLARALPPNVDARIDFLAVSSYAGTSSSGDVRLVSDLTEDVSGKHVVLVEDVVDTGVTLEYLLEHLGRRAPASLRTCALLDKPHRRSTGVSIDFAGFTCPDAFIVGYGLDYQEKYRNLPYLAKLDLRVSEV